MNEVANNAATAAGEANEPRHTPGPWVVERRPSEDGERLHVVAPDDTPAPWGICRVHRFCGAHGFGDNSESEANAHLIAAAPELLEALGEVLSTGLNGGNNYRLAMIAASRKALDDETLERAEASERAVKKAYAAINKALGKESR